VWKKKKKKKKKKKRKIFWESFEELLDTHRSASFMDHRLSGQHITASNPFLFFSFLSFFFPVCVLSVSHTSLQVPGESRNYVEPLIVSIGEKKALIVWELNMYALYTSQCCVVTHTTFLPSHSPTISWTVFKFIPVRSLASIQIPIVWSCSWDFFHGSDLPSTASSLFSLFSINIVIITYTDRTHLICIDIQNLKKKRESGLTGPTRA
jgi:hypothetical protein